LFAVVLVARSFADTETKRFYETGKPRRFPPSIQTRAAMRLTQLDAATVRPRPQKSLNRPGRTIEGG
jgi:plasmid maintenance system killer protein